jgi:hypothetical protein
MGILDSLFGSKNDEQPEQNPQPQRTRAGLSDNASQRPQLQNADEQALARYRYMLQTAPPEELEKAHEEAFARLTPEQRKLALQQMSQVVPESEARGLSDDPRTLARAATRAEMRQPGAMERMFGGANQIGGGLGGGGMMGGMGGMLAGSLLTSIAGSFIGSSIAHSFFSNPATEQSFQGSPEAQSVEGGASDYNSGDFQETGLDSGADPYGDPENAGASDVGADSYGDSGGFSDASLDSGFDSGGFDGGGFDGGDFGGDF